MRVRRALLLLLCPLMHAQPGAAKKPAPPDLFLVTIDTLRADHVHCFGYNKVQTPALDRLCGDGIRFTQAITASPITNSSHATILTGRYPSAHGVTTFGAALRPQVPTLAEQLHARGYKTAAFIGSFVLDSRTSPGLQRGFDSYDDFDLKLPESIHWGRVERRGGDVVARALAWLRAHPAGPHFVWVHLYDPHDPYEPPPPFAARYHDNPYDGEIAYADSALQTLLRALDATGRYRSSLIVASGDHGEGLGEHDEETHGIFLYDSTLRVPLIVKLPGLKPAGRVVTEQVRTVDIAPTILELLHAPALPVADGRSLAAAIEGRSLEPAVSLSETDYPLSFGWAPLRAAREPRYKYIEAPRPELYDLQSDPRELANTYQPWGEKEQELRGALASFRRQYPPVATGSAPVAQSTLDELRALGYLPQTRGETTAPEPSLLPDAKDKIQFQNLLHTAMVKEEARDLAAAHAALDEALRREPDSAAALAQLGSIELRTGDTKEGIAHLRRAIALNPSNATAARQLGEALERAGQHAEAAQALESALKASPGDAATRRLLGQVYSRLGEWAKAGDQLEAAVFLDPKDGEARVAFAEVLIKQGNGSRARNQLEKALQLDPANQVARRLLQSLPPGK